MANTYKNIVITPNTGSTTGDPTIVFSGGDSNTNTDIILRVYPTSNGTLSFEGNAGQLFSITNDLSNTIFSVNDVSGIPLLEINVASQQITLGQFYGNVGIGTNASNVNNYKLDVIGGANISLPNLTVGGTNVSAAIAAANANAATLSANVNTLAASFVSNSQSLSANVNVLAATFASANANNISLSANVNTLAASFVSNSQSLSANVNTLAATFAAANANNISLSTNVNILAAALGSSGGGGGGSVNVSTTGPTSNTNGSLWWNTNLGRLFIYYTDGDSNQWVEASPSSSSIDVSLIQSYTNAASNSAIIAFNQANTAYASSNTKLSNATVTLAGSLTTTGFVNSNSIVADSKGDVRSMPVADQMTPLSSYTLTINDTGKIIATNANIIIPNSIFSSGQAVSVWNNSAVTITIANANQVLAYTAGTSNVANKLLAQRGLATICCVSANTFVISGAGLS